MPNSFYYHRYGHESAFIRDSKKKNSSIVILQGILPFLNVIHEKDLDYIMSGKARLKWFENLENHPIRLSSKFPFLKKNLFKILKRIKELIVNKISFFIH